MCIIKNSVLNMLTWRLISNLFVMKHKKAHKLIVLDKVTINKVQSILNYSRDDFPKHQVHSVKQTPNLFPIWIEQMIFEIIIQLGVS